jgi:hypothetical protein
MRCTSITAACAIFGFASALSPPGVHAGTGGPPRGDEQEAAALFAERCSTCHAVPDPALRTDRAWLDQVRRTT